MTVGTGSQLPTVEASFDIKNDGLMEGATVAQLSFGDTWQVDPGRFTIFVGESSAHTPLTQDIFIPEALLRALK